MGYSAIGSAQDLINALRKKGYLETPDKQAARSLFLTRRARVEQEIADDDPYTFVVPCLGAVPAGDPREAIEDSVGTLRMSRTMFAKPLPAPESLFALRASGLSMMNAGILDGDWLVVKSCGDAPSGSIVVARVDGEATVKRLMRDRKSGWFLQPENPEFEPIFAVDDPFEIVGQVVALQRSIVN
jgi:repressor LexA